MPTSPLQTVWWDTAVTVAAVLAKLRLSATDRDADRLPGLVAVAGQLINEYLDRVDAPDGDPDDHLQYALVEVTIALLARQPSSESGALVIDFGSDPIGEFIAVLLPAKSRWGIA